MLTVARALLDLVIAHALVSHPIEACGLLVGATGSDLPTRVIPMRNVEQSDRFYRFDSEELLAVWAELDTVGQEPIVVYHSHPSTPAEMSGTDIQLAADPLVHYLIVSTRWTPPECRSYRLVEGRTVEEPIRVI